MAYSGLYRCSGCSVTFTDPAAWRAAPTVQTSAPSLSAPSDIKEPPSTLSTWGNVLPRCGEPLGFGQSEGDIKQIQDAAARAMKGRSKFRR